MNSIAFKFNYDDYAIEMGTGNIFQTILEDYETLGVIGEEHNKLMCYLAATSRLMDNPLNILVLSSSGAGKSTLQDKTLKLMPPESVIRASAITDKALFYMKSLKNKLLALEEAAGVKANPATSKGDVRYSRRPPIPKSIPKPRVGSSYWAWMNPANRPAEY